MANSQGQYDARVYGELDKEKMTYRRNLGSTLMDPTPLVTERHGRSGHDETHPYGKRDVDNNVAPTSSQTPWATRRYILERDDV